MKYRPLVWRNTHPYLVADRVEDLTPVEDMRDDPKCDRRVALYGYVRGTHLKHGMKVRGAAFSKRPWNWRTALTERGGAPSGLPAHATRSTSPAWATTPRRTCPSCRTRAPCQTRSARAR